MTESAYVHGYAGRESARLSDQANTLSDLLHHDTRYPAGNRLLECGCGTGAQTIFLARNSPGVKLVSVDVSAESLEQARKQLANESIENVHLEQADVFDLPYEEDSFDHVFVCFLLEHLENPEEALRCLRRVLKPGGSVTVIEGDHGSWYCHPQSREAEIAVKCLVAVQARMGGDSLIGRRLYPLVSAAGFGNVQVSPRMVYVDSSRPDLVEGFSKQTFIAMVEGVRGQALELGLVNAETWEKGIADLYRATQSDGTFCYCFFKAMAVKL